MVRPFPAPFLRRLTIADLHAAGACAQGVDEAREQLGLWDTAYPVSALLRRLKGLQGPDSYTGNLINRAAGRLFDGFWEAPYGEHFWDGTCYGHGTAYGNHDPLVYSEGDGSGWDRMAYGSPGAAVVDGELVGDGSGRDRYYVGYWDNGHGRGVAYEADPDWPPYPDDFLAF